MGLGVVYGYHRGSVAPVYICAAGFRPGAPVSLGSKGCPKVSDVGLDPRSTKPTVQTNLPVDPKTYRFNGSTL